MTLKATGGSCWWLFTSRAWVRAKMVWASCGLDGGPIKVTRFALYSWGPLWSKHTNGVVLFYFNITANKLLYYQDHEPIYMAEGKDCLKLWIGWMAHQEVWFVYDMDGVAKASVGMIQYEILVHPLADSKVLLAMYHCDGLVFWYWALAGKQWNQCWLVFLLCLAVYNFQML